MTRKRVRTSHSPVTSLAGTRRRGSALVGHITAALSGLLNAGHKTAHSRPAAGGGRGLESPDPGDDGAPWPVQGEDHGDTPAVKVENVADDGIQWEVEGGDHRLLLRLDHGGQSPPPPRGPRPAAA